MDLHLMKMTYYFIYTQDTKGTHHKLLYQALPISSFKYLNQKIWQIHIFTSTYFEILLIIELNLIWGLCCLLTKKVAIRLFYD
jgi:hypothetical protein